MTTQAYGYLRASTDRQDASVPAQKAAILEFARPNDVDVVQWFIDDGVSGKTFDRPSYRRMRRKKHEKLLRLAALAVIHMRE